MIFLHYYCPYLNRFFKSTILWHLKGYILEKKRMQNWYFSSKKWNKIKMHLFLTEKLVQIWYGWKKAYWTCLIYYLFKIKICNMYIILHFIISYLKKKNSIYFLGRKQCRAYGNRWRYVLWFSFTTVWNYLAKLHFSHR